MNERQEGLDTFVFAPGHAYKWFDSFENALDNIEILVTMTIERTRIAAMRLGWNARLVALLRDRRYQGNR